MSANVREIQSKSEFDQALQSGVVLVDFYAPWCRPCVMLAPVLEQVAGETHDSGTVLKVNVDQLPELAQDYQVEGIPTLVVLRDGKTINRYVGLQDKSTLVDAIEHASTATA